MNKPESENKKLKDYDAPTTNKWMIWVIIISSFISIATPGIGIIPMVLAIFILINYYITPKKYISKYTSLAKIDARIRQQQSENEKLYYDKKTLNDEIKYYKENARKDIEQEKDKQLKAITKEFEEMSEKVRKLNISSETLTETIDSKRNKLKVIEKELSEKLEFYNFKQLFPIDFENDSSSEIKNKLSLLTIQEKKLSDISNLISSDDINNKSHINNQKKQLIRMFDSECKYFFTRVNSKNFDRINSNIIKSYESLNRLFKTDHVYLTEKHLKIKLEKLKLIHLHSLKIEQEKELRKEEKAILREQLAAERELEQKRKIIEKDEKHFNNEIGKLMKYMQQSMQEVEKQIYIDKIKELEAKLKTVEEDKRNVEYKIAHAKAGYVYIISNIGSFGENIYKIGVTRRENPLDRIKDLGDASVPFAFDVHALIFAEDAFKLEKTLHNHFRKHEVNKVNHRKEFFNVNLDEIKDLVLKEFNNTVNFELEAKAEEYRESLRIANKS